MKICENKVIHPKNQITLNLKNICFTVHFKKLCACIMHKLKQIFENADVFINKNTHFFTKNTIAVKYFSELSPWKKSQWLKTSSRKTRRILFLWIHKNTPCFQFFCFTWSQLKTKWTLRLKIHLTFICNTSYFNVFLIKGTFGRCPFWPEK